MHTGYTDPIEETKIILYEMLEPTLGRQNLQFWFFVRKSQYLYYTEEMKGEEPWVIKQILMHL